MIDDCTAVILAGGHSRRMGKDKATTMLAGDTLLNHTIHALQPHFSDLVISVRQRREHLSLPQLCDHHAAAGPMAGIIAALHYMKTPWLFVVACDMPFVSAPLMHAIAEHRHSQNTIVPKVTGALQPLMAIYAQSCLPQMEQQITSDNRSLQSLLQRVQTTVISEAECRQHDPDLLSFMDMDSPKDIQQAESVVRRTARYTC